VIEGHPRVAIHAGVQGNASIRKLDELQFSTLVFSQDHQNVKAEAIGVPLQVLPCGNCVMAHIASSDEIYDHDVLDGGPRKG
jgi:hypothetical protein